MTATKEKSGEEVAEPVASDDGWTRVKVGLGEKFALGSEAGNITSFIGIFTGSGEYVNEDGEVFQYLSFISSSGEDCFCWSTWELSKAFDEIAEDSTVKIIYKGTAQVDKGYVKRFAVYVKA